MHGDPPVASAPCMRREAARGNDVGYVENLHAQKLLDEIIKFTMPFYLLFHVSIRNITYFFLKKGETHFFLSKCRPFISRIFK